jgi:excisionase family DNA binding protein
MTWALRSPELRDQQRARGYRICANHAIGVTLGVVSNEEVSPPEDPWLTIAEIAEELRCSPATIRSWISRGTLRAMRPGQRKLLVRRSELNRMLRRERADSAAPPPELSKGLQPSVRRRVPDSVSSVTWSPNDREAIDPEGWLGVAQWEWLAALQVSRMAPPDAWFVGRLAHIAEAAARKADALGHFDDDAEMRWESEPPGGVLTLSYELRPGGNRPGPADLWARFDAAVEELGRALEVGRAGVLRRALEQLSVRLHDIADSLGRYRGRNGEWRERSPDVGGGEADRPSGGVA